MDKEDIVEMLKERRYSGRVVQNILKWYED